MVADVVEVVVVVVVVVEVRVVVSLVGTGGQVEEVVLGGFEVEWSVVFAVVVPPGDGAVLGFHIHIMAPPIITPNINPIMATINLQQPSEETRFPFLLTFWSLVVVLGPIGTSVTGRL